MKKATVVGAGSFGTAMAMILASRGLDVHLWGRSEKAIDEINDAHTNSRYLPKIELPNSVCATTDLGVCQDSDLVVMSLPSVAFRGVCEQVREAGVAPDAVLLSGTKGIELSSGKRMTQVLGELFPDHVHAVLSGPSHAEEVARKMPTAAVIGCEDAEVAKQLQDIFTLAWFRSYTSTDVVGIEFGGTVKNIIALACGIVHGLGLGDNATAALATRGLAELVRLGTAMGGQPETFVGLSGVGDLIVTCFSEHSRNNRVGRLLGQGLTLTEAQERTGMVAEGVPNTDSVFELARKHQIRTPITDVLHDVLHEKSTPAQALLELLSRSPRPETD